MKKDNEIKKISKFESDGNKRIELGKNTRKSLATDDFENKIKTIKESYFPNQTKQDENVEQVDVTTDDSEETPVKVSNIMEAYSKAIARK